MFLVCQCLWVRIRVWVVVFIALYIEWFTVASRLGLHRPSTSVASSSTMVHNALLLMGRNMCVFMYVYMYICMHVYIYMSVCVCMYMYVCIYVCMYVWLCLGIYIATVERSKVYNLVPFKWKYFSWLWFNCWWWCWFDDDDDDDDLSDNLVLFLLLHSGFHNYLSC